MSVDYAIVVRAKTRLEQLIERFNTKEQAKFYIERQSALGSGSFAKKSPGKSGMAAGAAAFADYQAEHDAFHRALDETQSRLSSIVKYKIIDRSFAPSFMFAENHLVVVIGQDGLVANVAKYAQTCPIIAVNPDPARYNGTLLPFNSQNFLTAVEKTLKGRAPIRRARLAEARLDDGQTLLAFNDLFIGAASHVSARYRILWRGDEAEHSSSGVIVSTAQGATGWLSSISNMASGLLAGLGVDALLPPFAPGGDQLAFVVREAFKSARTSVSPAIGLCDAKTLLRIESLMPSRGVIFSDGVESDFMQFNSGAAVTIAPSERAAHLVTK